MSLARIIAPLLLLSVAGCGGNGGDTITPTPSPTPSPSPSPAPSPTPSPTPAASTRREISPTTVDDQVTAFTSPYIVINPGPDNAPKGKLLVMLPGTGATPQAYEAILGEAVARGYHAIGLSYPNDRPVDGICGQSSDPNCAGDVREEIITGNDKGIDVSVDTRNSIVGRLTELLNYLARIAPDENWSAFLVNGQPDWSKITVAGHSQGAGHAGYMGKLYALDRIAMFSGPADLGPSGQANWLKDMANVTSASQMYGFIHNQDQTVPPALAKQEWATLGLQGPPTEVDGLTAYSGSSHQLTTDVEPRNGSAHSSTVADRFTPLTSSGAPQFAPIWDYMAFP